MPNRCGWGASATWWPRNSKNACDREVRSVTLGHLQRGGPPTTFDRVLATQFGAHAMRLVVQQRFGEMVCYWPPNIDSVPISQAVNQLSRVNPNGSAVQAARALGISFGDAPARFHHGLLPWASGVPTMVEAVTSG